MPTQYDGEAWEPGDDDDDDEPRCIDKRGHKWVCSDDDSEFCYCERCGCGEY